MGLGVDALPGIRDCVTSRGDNRSGREFPVRYWAWCYGFIDTTRLDSTVIESRVRRITTRADYVFNCPINQRQVLSLSRDSREQCRLVPGYNATVAVPLTYSLT